MADGTSAPADFAERQALRRTHVRARATRAIHSLVDALVADDVDVMVEAVGDAMKHLTDAEAEILRGDLA